MPNKERNKDKSENKNVELLRMELKYCECCGSLWLRQCGSTQIYCASCSPNVLLWPAVTTIVHRARVPNGPRPGEDERFDLDLDADFNLGELELQRIDLDSFDLKSADLKGFGIEGFADESFDLESLDSEESDLDGGLQVIKRNSGGVQ